MVVRENLIKISAFFKKKGSKDVCYYAQHHPPVSPIPSTHTHTHRITHTRTCVCEREIGDNDDDGRGEGRESDCTPYMLVTEAMVEGSSKAQLGEGGGVKCGKSGRQRERESREVARGTRLGTATRVGW